MTTSHDSSYDQHLLWLTSQVHDLNRKINDLEQRLFGVQVQKNVRCLVFFPKHASSMKIRHSSRSEAVILAVIDSINFL